MNEEKKTKEQEITEQAEADQREAEWAAKLSEAEKRVEQYKDLLLRKAAEFENYKKRVETESATIVKFATEELLSELLPIVDDLERSLKLSKDRNDFELFYKGVELIHQKMLKFLSQQGVRPLETVGKEFSVDLHDALMQVPKEDVVPQTILEEVEKGYMLHGRVLRHAKVIVSTSPAPAETTNQPNQPSDNHQEPPEN